MFFSYLVGVRGVQLDDQLDQLVLLLEPALAPQPRGVGQPPELPLLAHGEGAGGHAPWGVRGGEGGYDYRGVRGRETGGGLKVAAGQRGGTRRSTAGILKDEGEGRGEVREGMGTGGGGGRERERRWPLLFSRGMTAGPLPHRGANGCRSDPHIERIFTSTHLGEDVAVG
jgi:hypothetical protein